jgi:uncharacterized protein YtpQ (UPF0354 family)
VRLETLNDRVNINCIGGGMGRKCKIFTLGLLLGGLLSCSNISEKDFTNEFKAVLEKQKKVSGVKIIDNLHIEYKYDNDLREFYLRNAYASLRYGESKKDVIDSYIDTAVMNANLNVIGNKTIFPNIRTVDWLEDMKSQIKEFKERNNISDLDDTQLPYYEPLIDRLIVVYTVEDRKTMSYLTVEQLNDLGINNDALRKIACTNLMNQSSNIDIEEKSGIFSVNFDGVHESSLILLNSVMKEISLKMGGDFLFSIPSRDTLVGIPVDTAMKNFASLSSFASEIADNGKYNISKAILLYTNGEIKESD